MTKNAAGETLQEMENLRRELYRAVNGKRELFVSREICDLSRRLDRLIIKHMSSETDNR